MMISRDKKKDFELHILSKFISHETHELRVKTIDEGETPDFVVRELNKDISIELTRLILPDLMKEEQFQEKIVSRAFEQFKSKYPDKLQVLVNFSNGVIKCAANEIHLYVDQLLGVVESVFLANRGFEFRISSIGRDRPINHFIDSITISNDLGFTNWQPFGAYMVKRIDGNWLKDIIRSKETRLPHYTRKVDENWLLLVANFGHESSTHEFDYLILEEFETSFDRVYLYKYMDNSYTRLL
ncbi:MAG: hypothetical protein J0I32_04475 [Sphingobacteriales bacterium]|nr:hypothetical protein [Sphingobacteriales bacterium]OJV98415.1 MAG: hypothetical protein BGO52_11545 [Sphingobacteriales bacterium 44-61]